MDISDLIYSTYSVPIGALVLLILLLFVANNYHGTFPPGPFSIPFFGVVSVDKSKHVSMTEWSKRYNSDIIGVKTIPGIIMVVSLNSIRAIREAFQSPTKSEFFIGRPHSQFISMVNPGLFGLLLSEGDLWRDQRRFALQTLRDFGLGKTSIENTIQSEMEDLATKIREHEAETQGFGRPDSKNSTLINPAILINKSVTNVICQLVFGARMGNDPEFEQISNLITRDIVTFTKNRIYVLAFAKLLGMLPGDIFGVKRYAQSDKEVVHFVNAKLKSHKLSYNENDIRDYIDAFINEMKIESSKGKTSFSDAQLARSIFDLFVAGMETTTTTLKWALLLMAANPSIQASVRAEIHEHLGHERLPSTTDRNVLKYTDAVLNEVARFATIVPLALPHRALESVQIGNYIIPKNALVFSNLYAVHRDHSIWPDADHFNPEANFVVRDSSGNGTIVGIRNTENLVPFGVGKRQCLGESLARQELWIFFVGLMQSFEVKESKEYPLPSVYDCVPGTIRAPLPYRILFLEN